VKYTKNREEIKKKRNQNVHIKSNVSLVEIEIVTFIRR